MISDLGIMVLSDYFHLGGGGGGGGGGGNKIMGWL